VKRRQAKPAGTAAVTPRKRRRRVIESVLVGIGCLVLVEALIGERGLVAMMRTHEEYQATEQALKVARAKYFRLKKSVQELSHDPAAIEDAARRDLGLIKPGEKVFRIKDLQSGSNSH
jgi:cell division protein FtsB